MQEKRNSELSAECSFDADKRKMIAYNRLYHDGYRWSNTWFRVKGTKDEEKGDLVK